MAVYHHELKKPLNKHKVYEWKQKASHPFDELLLSWEAKRPAKGGYEISISIHDDNWSPWILYADWSDNRQSCFKAAHSSVQVFQDLLTTKEPAYAFRIKVASYGGASLDNLRSLHACASASKAKFLNYEPTGSVFLPVKGLSQIALNDPRSRRLCSPVSTIAAIRFLNQENNLDPLQFATRCLDQTADIYGNWVLNTAQANSMLQHHLCWVERPESFQTVYASLCEGYPAVISVQGPLKGSASSYPEGHLILVIGYNGSKKEVACMDPAFPSDKETIVHYDLNDLAAAWKRRRNAAYLFCRQKSTDRKN